MLPVVSDERRVLLGEFEVVVSAAGRYAAPAELGAWSGALSAHAPTTMAALLAAHGQLELSSPPDLDAQDFWFRTRLPAELPEGAHSLLFEGLATLCDVWLEGSHVLRTQNMFRRYELRLPAPLRPGAELVLRFGALAPELAKRRARPRYRTRLVDAQQLRWVRTSLLGRTPGFAPRLPAVGPYRPLSVLARPSASVREHALSSWVERVHDAERGSAGLALSLLLEGAAGAALPQATLVLSGAALEARLPLSVHAEAGGVRVAGRFNLESVALWWPHTHGPQPRSQLTVELAFADGARLGVDFGQLGFRSLELARGDDGTGFALKVNGEAVFCRGACWTVQDLLTFADRDLTRTLELARAAGMNMLRVGGTMQYESDGFYEACDALGILVFQDFMFANMDYPSGDAEFEAEVRAEAEGFLTRLAGRPCLAILCGGSEVEQQAAMLGLPATMWRSALFYELLPEVAGRLRPEVPYVPNSPCVGALPFQVDAGVAHYYGVGAYLRPLHDARLTGVRFAAECLAFANVPEDATLEALLGELEMPFHHPRWKERVPRDRGAGWDFEDVRDHYLQLLYGQEPRRLRREAPERYLELSRAVVVDVMETTLAEFRRAGSSCAGALVWWLKDLWAGAGWGVIDAHGLPKSAYYALRRSFAPLALFATDEGMNGPELHLAHDGAAPLAASLRVTLYRAGRTPVAQAEMPLSLAARSVHRMRVDALFDRFHDAGYVYRFGPASHDLLVAQLRDAAGELQASCFVHPLGMGQISDSLGLSATFEPRAGRLGVLVHTEAFAARVVLTLADGLVPVDNYFHLEPNGRRWIEVRRPPTGERDEAGMFESARPQGQVKALNGTAHVRISA